LKVAYLINQYPKTSHSFVRREILALEKLGLQIERFSIRQVGEDLVDPSDRAELPRTRVLLAGKGRLLACMLKTAFSRPAAFCRALGMTARLSRPSDRGFLRHLAYLAEACVLLDHMRRQGIQHVHAHFGTNSAVVALLAHLLGGVSYSMTVHGPEEFDRPEMLSLGEKINHAKFVIAISEYGRSQLYRWCEADHWLKIHVVHCGVDDQFLAATPAPIPARPRLVCVGRLCEQKGQLLLLQAADERTGSFRRRF